MKKQIVILEIANDVFTGVSRYIEMLIDGLSGFQINLLHIKIAVSPKVVLPKVVRHRKHKEIQIPFPFFAEEILLEPYWNRIYNGKVTDLIIPFLQPGCILHIQTINLINLSLRVKERISCKIIAHIHCIPWKYQYSFNQTFFRYNYQILQKGKPFLDGVGDLPMRDEYAISQHADAVICVTNNAVQYFIKYLKTSPNKVFCIYNGIKDCFEEARENISKETEFIILFVGKVSAEKGVDALLDAMKILNSKAKNIRLILAGKEDCIISKRLDEESKNLNITRLGEVDYTLLKKLYQTSDIGVIPSLFEQCSYVALEMLMFGLPVVYSKIEGLEELFDDTCAIPVPVDFSLKTGLRIDTNELANKIRVLHSDKKLRCFMGKNARQRYLCNYQLFSMIQNTMEVYKQLAYNEKV